jgi:FolB domain-containing protein
MDTITISDLEVFYCVGVPDEERAKPQRLLLTVEMEHDFRTAASEDELAETIDYFAVSQRLHRFGDGVHWRLIETLAVDIAQMVLEEFRAVAVSVEVKKFIIPEARYISVRIKRTRT